MYLLSGTLLQNRYAIEQVIGHGGFGVTYLARDLTLNVHVAIKEYLPRQLATRAEGVTHVSVFSGEAREHFAYGLQRFLEEARSIARFANHPNIVSARDYFEANGTAYMVMEYIDGITFKQFLDQNGGKIPFELAKKIMLPVMDALRQVHDGGLLHRDISPDNIYLTTSGQVKLLDFGAARYFAGEQSKSLSIILKAGYAPEEQYRSRGKQGAWTDVYAVAATIYRAITGITPPEALDRKEEDTLQPPSQFAVMISPGEEQVLGKALAVNAAQRFQTMRDFQEALQNGMAGVLNRDHPYRTELPMTQTRPVAASLPSKPATFTPAPAPIVGKKSSATTLAVIFSVAAFLIVVGGRGVIWHFASRSDADKAFQGNAFSNKVISAPAEPSRLPSKPETTITREHQPSNKQSVPYVTPTQKLSADELFNQGRALFKQGKFEEAIPKLEKAVELNPYLAQAHYILGWVYNNVDRSLESLRCFQNALNLKNEALYYDGLAWTYNKLGRSAEAIEAGKQAVKLDFHFPDAHYNLGMAYLASGDLDMARKEYDSLGRMKAESNKAKENADRLRDALEKRSYLAAAPSSASAPLSPNPINQSHQPSGAILPDSEALHFVERHLWAVSNNDLNGVLNSYADVVNYFKRGVQTKEFIKKDKIDYAKRFPTQRHDLVGGIEISDRPDGLKIVKFQERFMAQNPKIISKGLADNTWWIKKINNKYKIVKEEQKVIYREIQ
jgi:serine/threonine protein kinase